jgi:beta-glucosidase
VTIEVAVKNTGNFPGKEVIQLYLREENPAVVRPEKELEAFNKIALAAGEENVVKFQLSKRDFAYYDTDLHDWNVRSGKFCVLVGGSSLDLPLKETIEVQTTTPVVYAKLTRTSMLKDFQIHPKGQSILSSIARSIWYGYSFGERRAFARRGRRKTEAAPVCAGRRLPGRLFWAATLQMPRSQLPVWLGWHWPPSFPPPLRSLLAKPLLEPAEPPTRSVLARQRANLGR